MYVSGKPQPPSKGPEHEAHWKRVHRLVRDAQWSKLMSADQLKNEQAHSRCFVGFAEGRYNFNPTFKARLFVLPMHACLLACLNMGVLALTLVLVLAFGPQS